MIISLLRPIILFSLTTIIAVASISCNTEVVSVEEFSKLTTELAATKSQLKGLQIKLSDAEFKVSQYETRLREYTTIVDADYPNLLSRVEQARLILELIIVSLAYDQGLATELEMMSVFANVEKIDSSVVKEGIIKMMASGELMSDEEGGELISTWLDEVYRLLQ